jgi:hypothetical protein
MYDESIQLAAAGVISARVVQTRGMIVVVGGSDGGGCRKGG